MLIQTTLTLVETAEKLEHELLWVVRWIKQKQDQLDQEAHDGQEMQIKKG